MTQDHQDAINDLNELLNQNVPDTLNDNIKFVESVRAILRNYGDQEMQDTFNRLTKWLRHSPAEVRNEKTKKVIEVLIKDFTMKIKKKANSESDDFPEVDALGNEPIALEPVGNEPKSNATLHIIYGVIIAILGSAVPLFYTIGHDNGNNKFDQGKLELVDSINSLKEKISELEADENTELRTLRINVQNYQTTFEKLSAELKACEAELKARKMKSK
jgi:hypothetical protein